MKLSIFSITHRGDAANALAHCQAAEHKYIEHCKHYKTAHERSKTARVQLHDSQIRHNMITSPVGLRTKEACADDSQQQLTRQG
jgi:hypothetical protein